MLKRGVNRVAVEVNNLEGVEGLELGHIMFVNYRTTFHMKLEVRLMLHGAVQAFERLQQVWFG